MYVIKTGLLLGILVANLGTVVWALSEVKKDRAMQKVSREIIYSGFLLTILTFFLYMRR